MTAVTDLEATAGSSDEIPLMHAETEAPSGADEGKCEKCKEPHLTIIPSMLLLFGVALGALAILLLYSISSVPSSGNCGPRREIDNTTLDAVYSPARVVEEFQAVQFDGAVNTTNPWKGSPSEDLDVAWSDLFEVGPMAVSSDTLEKIGKTSIEIPSQPGFHLGKLAVFHQLHCLDKIRRYVHNDYYQMDDSHSSVSTIDHIDHCVDIVRQAVMCKADTTLLTFHRKELFETDPDFEATHACSNFDVIHDWARDREIDMDREMEEHPEAFQRQILKDVLGVELDGEEQSG